MNKIKLPAMSLKLNECRALYETHFGEDLPGDMPYNVAANNVFEDLVHNHGDEAVKRFMSHLDLVRRVLALNTK